MNRLPVLVVLAATALAVPAAAGTGSLHANAVRMDAFAVHGLLRAVQTTGHSNEAPVSGFDLRIQASRLSASSGDRSDAMIVAGASKNPTNDTQGPYPFAEALVSTQAVRGLYTLMVVPQAGARVDVTAPAGLLQASPHSDVRQNQHIQGTQPPLQARVGDALLLTAPAAVQMSVQGNFDVALWDWDVVVQSPGGGRNLPSGPWTADVVAPAGVQVLGRGGANETYLHVENGTLSLTLPQAPDSSVFLGPTSIEGTLTLTGAHGTLEGQAGTQEVSGTLRLDGAHATTMADAGAVALILSEPPAGGDLNGKSLAFAAPGRSTSWLLFAPLLAIVPVAGAAWGRSGRRRLRLAQAAMDDADYEGALAASERLVSSRRHRVGAAPLRTIAFLRLGRLQEAERLLAEDGLWPGPAQATRDYLSAHATAVLGLEAQARSHLAACLARDPGFRAEAMANPVLANLVRALPTVREGYT